MKPLLIILFTTLLFIVIFISYFSSHGSIVVKQIELTPDEDTCLNELLGVAFDGKGQGLGWIYVTGKEGNKIFLHLHALWEFNTYWIAECPGGIGRAELMI